MRPRDSKTTRSSRSKLAPQVIVTRRVRFCAAHRLHNPKKSDAWNAQVFGKCNSENFHGHNYELEVQIIGTPDSNTGYVIDLSVLADLLETQIVCKCDHKNLNLDVAFLKGIIPSAENLALVFWQLLHNKLPSGKLYCVRVIETENNSAEYYGR